MLILRKTNMLKIPGSMGVARIDLGSSKGSGFHHPMGFISQDGHVNFCLRHPWMMCDFFEIIHRKLGQIQEYPRRVRFRDVPRNPLRIERWTPDCLATIPEDVLAVPERSWAEQVGWWHTREVTGRPRAHPCITFIYLHEWLFLMVKNNGFW